MVNDKIPENQKHSFKTANMYHFIGTFGLIASSMSSYPKVVCNINSLFELEECT